jgi:hypothetical protein
MIDGSPATPGNWLAVLRDLPLESRGLLLDLVVEAVQGSTPALQVDQALLESLTRSETERSQVAQWFDELLRHGMVREIASGNFLIVPALWGFGLEDEEGGPRFSSSGTDG